MIFFVPGPEAPLSGGNRYNEALIAQLGARRTSDAEGASGVVWVDSLFLAQLPSLRPRATRLGLLAHSLPSLLSEAYAQQLDESALLALLDCAVAPSETMRDWLRERAPQLRVRVVEPAVDALPVHEKVGPLQVSMVANLTPNKGVLPFLEALASEVRAQDRFTLRVIGRLEDSAYARRCVAFAESRIVFCGALPFDALRAEYARAHALVSASRSESYGMAIAEARAHGCIVLARAGGHVAKLLNVACDSLVESDHALVEALLAIARDPSSLAERSRCALATKPCLRSWRDVADEFAKA